MKRWRALGRVADDGRYLTANNPIENTIRPIGIGRKNWLFAGSETAGKRSATIMNLLATARCFSRYSKSWKIAWRSTDHSYHRGLCFTFGNDAESGRSPY